MNTPVSGYQSADDARELLLKKGISGIQARAAYIPAISTDKAPLSIQNFAKKKRIKLEKSWQIWIYMEWIKHLFADRQRMYKLSDEFWTLARMAYENIRLKRRLREEIK